MPFVVDADCPAERDTDRQKQRQKLAETDGDATQTREARSECTCRDGWVSRCLFARQTMFGEEREERRLAVD